MSSRVVVVGKLASDKSLPGWRWVGHICIPHHTTNLTQDKHHAHYFHQTLIICTIIDLHGALQALKCCDLRHWHSSTRTGLCCCLRTSITNTLTGSCPKSPKYLTILNILYDLIPNMTYVFKRNWPLLAQQWMPLKWFAVLNAGIKIEVIRPDQWMSSK